MNFIAPEFLYALGFLAIPILIHLFNFRRYKTVKFSQVRFLKNIKQQTQSTSRLKHLLVLLARCLALACLVFAFAQPYLSENEQIEVGKKGVIIYIDNSFSMQAKGEAGNLLDMAKSKAVSIAEAYSESDRFQLHTNDFSGNQLRWLNKDAFIDQLQNVDFSPVYRKNDAIVSRIRLSSSDEENYVPRYYMISDLQKINFSSSDQFDSTLFYYLPVTGVKNQNVWSSSVTSFSPYHVANQSEKLLVTLKSDKEQSNSYNGQLNLNGNLKTPFSFNLENKDSLIRELNYRNSSKQYILGEVSIKDFPVSFDDLFYFNYQLEEPVSVLHIYNGVQNKNLKTLFEKDSIINYRSNSMQQIDFSAIESSSLIILDELSDLSSGLQSSLSDFLEKGGSLAIFPSATLNTESVNAFLNSRGSGFYGQFVKDTIDVTAINSSAKIFNDVFEEKPEKLNLPRVTAHHKILQLQNTLKEEIFRLRNGDVFLSKYTLEKGAVYLSSVNLNKQSNFPEHALFVPVMFNMALQSVIAKPMAYYLGEQRIEIPLKETSESPLKLVKDGQEIIPKQELNQNTAIIYTGNSITEAGHYKVKQNEELIQYLSFNYDRKESELDVYTAGELLENASRFGLNLSILESNDEFLSEKVKDSSVGITLWKHFIVLALFFLLLEILFLRILK